MYYYKKALSNFCQICGLRALKYQEIKLKRNAKKACYYVPLIRLLFEVYIAADSEDIHPQVLCMAYYCELKYVQYVMNEHHVPIKKKLLATSFKE